MRLKANALRAASRNLPNRGIILNEFWQREAQIFQRFEFSEAEAFRYKEKARESAMIAITESFNDDEEVKNKRNGHRKKSRSEWIDALKWEIPYT